VVAWGSSLRMLGMDTTSALFPRNFTFLNSAAEDGVDCHPSKHLLPYVEASAVEDTSQVYGDSAAKTTLQGKTSHAWLVSWWMILAAEKDMLQRPRVDGRLGV
jgi:hypothetical protein